MSINGQQAKAASQILPQPAFQGSCLAFRTLCIFLEQMGDSAVCPSAHTSLAFIWCLALHPLAMQQVEQLIPWLGLTKFLNRLFQIDTDIFMIENEAFPLPQCGVTQQLFEDYCRWTKVELHESKTHRYHLPASYRKRRNRSRQFFFC